MRSALSYAITSAKLAKALLHIMKNGADKTTPGHKDINAIAASIK